MYEGHLRFGGVEVINTERLQAYVRNGLVPVGTTVDAHTTCEGLGETITGPNFLPYRTPIYDQPPWYDPTNPDSWDFAGVLPLEVTGLDGSTATVDVQELLRGGGQAGRRRWRPRTVAVSAVLVGRTTESVVAGLAWLTTALHRTCVEDDTCGSLASLQGFTACPGPMCQTADLDALPITTVLDDPEDPLWEVRSGTFDRTDGSLTPTLEETSFVDGGAPDSMLSGDTVDGGGPLDSPEMTYGGYGPLMPSNVVAPGLLGGPQFPALAGPVTMTWELSGNGGDSTVQLVLLDEVGAVVLEGPTYAIGAASPSTEYAWTLPLGVDVRLWRAAIITTDPDGVIVDSLTVETQPQLTSDQCAAPYERTLPRVTTVAGPTVVRTIPNADCADFLEVEWTWVVGSPYRYGHTEPLAIDVRPIGATGTVSTYEAPGVSTDWHNLSVSDRAKYVCVPAQAPAPCYQDPCAPGFALPPASPYITDPDQITADSPEPGGVSLTRLDHLTVCLNTPSVPGNSNVLTISLRNDENPKLGVRVRVYDQVEPECVETSPCDFAYEYLIDYIPAGGILTIDGVAGTVTTLCQDTIQDSSASVRGTYGGALPDPVVRCNQRYLLAIDWLHTYPRTCEIADGVYAYRAGFEQGTLGVDVSITPREG